MIRNESFVNGVCVEAEVIDLDAGTVAYEVDGKVVESRRLTPEELALNTPPPPSEADRLAALEATNAELLAALARVTSLAQIRAAVAELA
jgi:surfactin synthase thioesterase subunit